MLLLPVVRFEPAPDAHRDVVVPVREVAAERL